MFFTELYANNVYSIVYAYIDGIEKFSFIQGKCTVGMQKFLQSRKGDKRTNIVNTPSELIKGNPFYITCIDAPEKLVTFSDGKNDIYMFEMSDESYVVENADEELKNIETKIIESNNNDGIAKWLKEHVRV